MLDLCVLGALHRHESYGYELAQSLQAAGLGPIKGGTLYPVLLRLQRTGLVSAQWRDGAGGPARKYYQLTPSGAAALRQAATDWRAFSGGVDTILQEVTAP